MGFWDTYAQQSSSQGNVSQSGGYSGGSYPGGGYQESQPFSWRNFMDNYQQVQQAAQQYGWQDYTNPQNPFYDTRQDEQPRYRQMTDLERFSAGARQASDKINNAVGNWLFGAPKQGEDVSAIKPENVPRMLANIPGMFIGSIPDLAAYGSELIAGTPAQEGNLETGMIEDRKLTPEEAGADILYGGLSALSMIPGVGVEAKLAGAGLKAAGKATGSKLAQSAGRIAATGENKAMGAIEQAAYDAGKRGSDLTKARWKDAGVSALTSGAFESFQEGAQTAAEDIRYHQFDLDDPNETRKRIAEGAFWGGLAGGLVGGAPSAVHAARIGNVPDAGTSDPSSGSPAIDASAFRKTTQSDWESLQAPNTTGRLTPGMRSYYDDLAKSDNRLRADGAVNLILRTSDNRLGLHQWSVGVDDFVDAWNQGDRARSGIARAFAGQNGDIASVTNEINAAITTKTVDGNEYSSVAEAMNALNLKYNGERGFEAAIEKRPGAKYTGGYGYVSSFVDGRGFVCNPALVKQINADFDSDMGVLHFVTRSDRGGRLLNLDGFFGEKVLSPEGTSLVDFYYTDYNPDRFKPKAFKEKLYSIFYPYSDQVVDETGEKKNLVKYFLGRMSEAVESNDNQKIAEVIEEIRQTVTRLKDAAIREKEVGLQEGQESVLSKKFTDNNPDYDPNKFKGSLGSVSSLFQSTEDMDRARVQRLKEEKKAMHVNRLAKIAVKTMREDPAFSDDVKKALENVETGSPLYRHGTLSGTGHSVDTYELIGLVLYTLEKKANQPFRQHGQLGLNHAKAMGAYTEAFESLYASTLSYDLIDAIIRCSFRVARTGTTPLDAIEGLIDSKIIRDTENGFDLESRRVESEQDFDDLEKLFVEAWDEGAEDYRAVHTIPTVDGIKLNPSAPVRNSLDGKSQTEVDIKFLQMFSDRTLGSIFKDAPAEYAEFSLGDVVAAIAEGPMRFSRIFANATSSSMNNIMDRLVKAHLEEKVGLRRSIESLFKETKLESVLERMKDNNGKIHPSDWGAITWYVQQLVDLITPEGFHYLGITDPIDFIENTEFGQRLIDPNYRVRLNAFVSLLSRAKFGLYQDAILKRLPGLTEEEADQARENAIAILSEEYIGRPGIQDRIASELIANNGESNTLEVMMSLDGTLESKESQYKEAFGVEPGTDILVDLLIDTNDDFSISTVSKKYRAASQSMANYQRALFSESRKAVGEISTRISNGTLDPRMFVAAMDNAAKACRIEVSDEPVVLAIFDSLGTAGSKMEKGVNPQAASSIAEQANIQVLGNPLAYFDSITTYADGAVALDNFAMNPRLILAVMSGQDLSKITGSREVRVYDGARSRIVDRDWIFSQISPTYDPSRGPDANDWLAFLDRFPQYEAYFAGVATQPVISGGEGSATLAKTDSIINMVEDYQHAVANAEEGTDDSVVARQRDHALMIARNALMRDSRFSKLSIFCMEDMADPANTTLSAIRSGYGYTSRRLVNAILYDALSGTDMAGDRRMAKAKRQLRASVIRSNFDTVDDLYDDAVDRLERYGQDLFDFGDQVREIRAASNRDELTKETAQKLVNDILKSRRLPTGVVVDDISTTDGVLVDGKLDLMELQLMAKYNADQIQEIIELTESIQENDDLDVGEFSDPLIGLGTPDNISISPEPVRRLVDNALEEAGLELMTDEEWAMYDAALSRSYNEFSSRTSADSYRDLVDALNENGRDGNSLIKPIPRLTFDMLPTVKSGGADIRIYGAMDEIIKYLKAVNAYSEYQKDPQKFVEENFYTAGENGVGKLRAKEWRDFIQEVNNRIIERTLRETNEALGVGVNENAYCAAFQWFQAYDELVRAVRQELTETVNPWGNGTQTMYIPKLAEQFEDSPDIPIPDFTRRYNQACATEFNGSVSGGQVPGSISRNGGFLKQSNATSWLPYNRAGVIQPTNYTVQQIEDMRARDDSIDVDQWICIKSGDWKPGQESYDGKEYEITTVGAMLRSGEDLSNGIMVFDPKDNPHGMWITNTPASLTDTNKPALRLSSIIGGIIDASQEPLVLKLKKRYEEKTDIVDDKGFGSRKPGTLRRKFSYSAIDNNAVSEVSLALREALGEYRYGRDGREGFVDYLNSLFNGELEDTGYGYTQARILAQGLTPGVIVNINGTTRCISAETIFSPELMSVYMNDIFQREGKFEISSGRTFTISPSELHHRIVGAVHEAETKARETGTDVNKSDIRNAAYDRCTQGWNSWLDDENQLNVDEIFSRGSALGWRHPSTMTPEEAATVYAKYLDLDTKGRYGSIAKPPVVPKKGKPINSDTDKGLAKAIRDVTDTYDIKGFGRVKPMILKIFMSDEDKEWITGSSSRADFYTALDMVPDNVYWTEPGKSIGAGIVTDRKQLKSALGWSENTGNLLLVPRAWIGELKKNRDVGGEVLQYGVTVDGDDYVVYDSTAINTRLRARKSVDGESSVVPFNINSIQGTCLNKEHVFNPGDATLQVSEELSQRIVDAKSSKQSIRQLTNGIYGRISMIHGKSAEKLIGELYEQDGKPKSKSDWRDAKISLTASRFSDVPIEQLQSDMYDFLTSAKDNSIDEDGFDRKNAGRNRILGILNVESSNGDQAIVPILAPNNSPEQYDSCSISIGNDGNIYITYSSSLQTFGNKPNEQYFKASLPDMSFKGVVAVVPEGIKHPEYIMQGSTRGTTTENGKINLITSYDTVKSRIPGRELQVFISDMWYFSKLEGLSALYDRNGEVKKFIVDQYTDELGVLDSYGLSMLLQGDRDEWKRVARGEIVLSSDPETQKIHREIVRNYGDKIDLQYLFSPGWDSRGVRTEIDIRFFMALGKSLYDYDRVLRFFHSIDQNLCPNGLNDDTDVNEYMFDDMGRFHMISYDNAYWEFVKWGKPDGIGAFSELTGQSSKGGESHQAFIRLAMDKGYNGRDTQMALDYAELQAADPELYRMKAIKDLGQRKRDRIYAKRSSKGYNKPVSSLYYATRAEREQERKIRSCNEALDPSNRRAVYYQGKRVENPYADEIDGVTVNYARSAYNELQKHFSSPLSTEIIDGLVVYQTGYTFDDGKGTNSISLKNLADAIRAISKNIEETGLPITSKDMYDIRGGRIPQPLINQVYARALWNTCEEIRMHEDNQTDGEPDFDKFVSRMQQEQETTDSFLHSVSGKKYIDKKKECLTFSEYNWRQWGKSGQSGLIYETYTAEDIINVTNWFLEPVVSELEAQGLNIDELRKLNEQSAQMIADGRRMADGRRYTREAPSPNARNGVIGSQPVDYSRGYHKIFSGLTDLSRLMGVLDIFLTPSNVAYRGINQGIMGTVMSIGRKFGVVDRSILPNQDYVRRAARDDTETRALWSLLREAAFAGDQTEMFAYLQQGGTISEYLDMKSESESPTQRKYQKARDLIYKLASGGDIGISGQIENFFNRLVFFFNEDPALRKYWLEKRPETGTNRMEDYLSQDGGGAKLLQEVFFDNEANISLLAGMNALESARGADIAQSHILIEIFKNVTNKHPIPEFLVTTTVSRFPRYALNFMEECINLVLPMCTLRQAFISFAAEVGHTRAANARDNGGNYIDPHYEKLLRNTNMREAMIVDALHFGAFGMLCILAGLPGAIQPPEDEKKWGNYKEWLLLQHRVGEAWWIEDILGIVAPAACFWKSVQLGKPRFDLITNGISDVCYNNPMIKISDAVEFMMDPTGEINRDYQAMVEKYAASPDSRTGFMDYIQAKGTSFGLSYVSQFFTPTFIKSMTNWGTPYELDYKNVYSSNVRGVLTEGGREGEDLVRTSYEDAMIRRLSRKNPVLALIMDITRPGTTSYSGSNLVAGITGKMPMPYTRYLDQHQYDGMKQWSIAGMDEADAQAKAAYIITLLEQYQDDLGALTATGFYLDYETKRAVSSMIWDTYYQLDSEWNEFNQSDQSDYKVLGNGDWDAGKALYYEMKEMYQQNKRWINSFYYKVMKSPELSQPIVEYRRYNTSYAQDDEGNFYATGFHPQSILPFTSAPGTLTDPEGTAGYENDFVTVSAVTGRPLENMRALVPMNAGEYTDWPDLESWADDGNGNGYSKVYQDWYGTDSNGVSIKTPLSGTDLGSSTKKPSGTKYPTGGYGGGYRRSGGGGGGRRSSGGGYVPNAYAPSVDAPTGASVPRGTLSKASPSKIMNTDRLVEANEYYLRPDFETKGSREAYKRSDI